MNQSHLSEQFEQEIYPTRVVEFSYDILDDATRIVVQQRTSEIKSLLRRTAQDIIDVGLKLSEVKQELGHGNFLAWIRREFDWSESAARKFMQVAREFKTVKFTNLNIATSALYLLAADSTPEEARFEALQRARSGEVITRPKAKAIAQQYQPSANDRNVVNNIIAQKASEASVESVHCRDEKLESNSVDYYAQLIEHLNLLSESQVAAIWQELSQHLNPQHLNWHDWSKDKLEYLVAQVQQELSGR